MGIVAIQVKMQAVEVSIQYEANEAAAVLGQMPPVVGAMLGLANPGPRLIGQTEPAGPSPPARRVSNRAKNPADPKPAGSKDRLPKRGKLSRTILARLLDLVPAVGQRIRLIDHFAKRTHRESAKKIATADPRLEYLCTGPRAPGWVVRCAEDDPADVVLSPGATQPGPSGGEATDEAGAQRVALTRMLSLVPEVGRKIDLGYRIRDAQERKLMREIARVDRRFTLKRSGQVLHRTEE